MNKFILILKIVQFLLRGEKEIPNALQNMISNNKDAIITFPLCEHVPDITYKDDISVINSFLD